MQCIQYENTRLAVLATIPGHGMEVITYIHIYSSVSKCVLSKYIARADKTACGSLGDDVE